MAWAGGAAIMVAMAAVTTLAVVLFFDGEDTSVDEGPSGPSLERTVTLRASPSHDAEGVARLEEGVPVTIAGRSEDSTWLVVELPGRLDVVGWVPADAIAEAGDLSALPEVGGTSEGRPPASSTTVSAPTLTPDLPDLTVEAVFSRDNRLVVVVANVGNADVGGAVLISVDGREPNRVDVGGKPLRPGDTLEAVLAEEYVQRRATVRVDVSGEESVKEEDSSNNSLQRVIAPDLDNDIEALSAALDPDDGHLVVTVRNNSLIPLVGTVTIAVRATSPAPELLERLDAPLGIDAGGTRQYDFPELTDLDLTRVQVIVSSDAINDADANNNVFPR